ncbi:hypothetical protein ACGFT2_11115 [Streptomyces sp. NPDC048514]|uniref:hypothetical protein n=1 Tax=Streptomyces sp. NPDC048514 TaxID=3365564 RepID=UPI0037151D9D
MTTMNTMTGTPVTTAAPGTSQLRRRLRTAARLTVAALSAAAVVALYYVVLTRGGSL